MIPAYNPTALLEQTLRAVLDQDEGPERMQVAVVDDASPGVDVAALVRDIAGDRVEFYRNATNLGLAGNWNRCIELACGRWVHLLHQDDLILPGFYERMGKADAARPEVGAAFCRHHFIRDEGQIHRTMDPERDEPGVLDGWLERMAEGQPIQSPAMVVRRAAYEALGGFRTDLCYALDWEMWVRIAAAYPIWYEPEILACYRLHEANESARLKRSGMILDDIRRAMALVRELVPEPMRARVGKGLLAWQRDENLSMASRLMRAGDRRAGMVHLRRACECDPALRRSATARGFRRWALKLWLANHVPAAARFLAAREARP
jgi:glycosyltransferase involved in cell wall biosynthesis